MPVSIGRNLSIAQRLRQVHYKKIGSKCPNLVSFVPVKVSTPKNLREVVSLSPAKQAKTLLATLEIKNLAEVEDQLGLFCHKEAETIDFPRFAEAIRFYVDKFEGKRKVTINEAIFHKLANPELAPKECAENAWLFAHPKELAASYINPPAGDYSVIDLDHQVRNCFLGKIETNHRVLIISYDEGQLAQEISERTNKEVIVVCPIKEQVAKIKKRGLKVYLGNPNRIDEVLAKNSITGHFQRIVLSEAIGELDVHAIFNKLRKYCAVNKRNPAISTKILVTTYLPDEKLDSTGYERMTIDRLGILAEKQQCCLVDKSTRVFEIYEKDGRDDILISEVSNPQIRDGFAYLEFEPLVSDKQKGFSLDVPKNITCIADVDVPTFGHGAMGFDWRADGSMIIGMQCEGIYIADKNGRVKQGFNGYSLYGKGHIDGFLNDYRLKNKKTGEGILRNINSEELGGCHFGFMQDINIDNEGNVYIGDSYNQFVVVFDKDWRFVRRYETGGGHNEINKILLDNKKEKLHMLFGGSVMKVFSKAGEIVEEIVELDGIKLSQFRTFTFTPEGGYCFVGRYKAMVFSPKGKLEKEIKFPVDADPTDVAVNSRGEIFVSVSGYSDPCSIIVYDSSGKLIANVLANQQKTHEVDFALRSVNTLNLIDDDTLVVSSQHPRKLLTYSLGDKNYTDHMIGAVSKEREALIVKLKGLKELNLVYHNNIETIMGRLYGLYLRGSDLDLIEQTVDFFIDNRGQILRNFDDLCDGIFEVLGRSPQVGQVFFAAFASLIKSQNKQPSLKTFLLLAKTYFGVSGKGLETDEKDLAIFTQFYELIQKMETEKFVLRNSLLESVVTSDRNGSARKREEAITALKFCQLIHSFPAEQYGIKSRDWQDLSQNINSLKDRVKKLNRFSATKQYFEFLPLYCGKDKIPFRVFSKLFNIFGPNKKMMGTFLKLFQDKEGTFVATREFEEALREKLAMFKVPIDMGKKVAEEAVRNAKSDEECQQAKEKALLAKNLFRAKSVAFMLATKNLVWQKHNSQTYTLKNFLITHALFVLFGQNRELINEEVIAAIKSVNHKHQFMEAAFSAAYEFIFSVFALGLMKIDVSSLMPADKQAYEANEKYFATFLPLGLKYAKDHPKYLPILKLIFLASLRGEFQKLRNDKEYFPEWLYDYFKDEAERAVVEKYFFKRSHHFALDEALSMDDSQVKAMWVNDEEEVVRVDKRDFQDMISSIVHGAYKAGFTYLSANFKETQKIVSALNQDEYVGQMKEFRSLAQELLYVAELVKSSCQAEEIKRKTKKLSAKFIDNIFMSGSSESVLSRLKEEYKKVVFRQNIFSAARLANELGNKNSGVEPKMMAFAKQAKQLSGELAKYNQLLADYDLNHPAQETVRHYKEDVLFLMKTLEEKASAGEEKLGVMRVLSQMITFITDFEEYLYVLVNKSNSLANRLQRVDENHAADGYIDSVPSIVKGASASITHFRVKDTSDPVDILLALQGQCLDYKTGSNNHGLTDIMLNPLVKVNIVQGRNGTEKMLANQMVLLGQIVDGNKKARSAIILDQTYGTWGTSREYLLTKIKKTFVKAKRMGKPLVIPKSALIKVGMLPTRADKMSEEDFKAETKEALSKIRVAISEDFKIKSMREKTLAFRFFSGAAPFLYTDLGSRHWWSEGSRHYTTTEVKASIIIE